MVKPGLLSCKIDNSGVDDEENLSNLMEKSDISEGIPILRELYEFSYLSAIFILIYVIIPPPYPKKIVFR